jgi:hypothetical protein
MTTIDPICHDKLLIILHTACSEIRRFIRIGAYQRVYDLADVVESIPEQMLHWGPEYCDSIREALQSYQSKYSGSGFDYAALLDMSDAAFTNCYLSIEPARIEDSTAQDART